MYQFSIEDHGKGSIQIDDFKELFDSDFSFWSKLDYENHWVKASEELLGGNAVCFITSITDPNNSNFIRSWACYPINGKLVFQE
ncbi:MAG: hypothetical protein KBT87_02220 [Gammaproteobacteria bacterium]|nr:hypothetical protein [Gammaproteobacteria bacterium]MBQ0773467.1 hypothetical protein [Gammaproteobacteria bacterium]